MTTVLHHQNTNKIHTNKNKGFITMCTIQFDSSDVTSDTEQFGHDVLPDVTNGSYRSQ